jgi:hypothetical protein
MIEYITKNWTYFVAFATVIAYVFEKSYSFWTERKKKQQAYNRTFVAIVKFPRSLGYVVNILVNG